MNHYKEETEFLPERCGLFVSCFNIQSHTKKTDSFKDSMFTFKEEHSLTAAG